MELASYLAGERWSAHPACTHPLLAALARDVNDHTPDTGLARLAVLAPSVIGLTARTSHLDARITLVSRGWRCRWRRPAGNRSWLRRCWRVSGCWARYPDLPTGLSPALGTVIVHAAVEAIAQTYIPQPDQMLRDLLIGAIGQCARQAGRGTPA